jgi:hypothetical protein
VSPEDDAGLPIAYQALAAGTPVHTQDGGQVGTVKQVLAVEEEDVFDGLVIDTDTGSRFIDADQVAHIAEHRVDIRLTNAGRGRDLWRRLRLRGLWRKE